MNELIPAADPLGLPVPVWLLLGLKVFGFFLHLVFMNLWLAGLPTALFLLHSRPAAAEHLFRGLPFFLAFGINAGIVPLLFLQTLYPQFFYPATILQAWFWFSVIPLLLVAYYAVYLASFGKFRVVAGLTATVLVYVIGVMFSSAMSLTARPETWPKIFTESAQAGAVHGFSLYLNLEVLLRFLLVVGMAFGTLAGYFVVVAEWFATEEAKPELRKLVGLYFTGAALYAVAGGVYASMILPKLPQPWFAVAGISLVAGVVLAGIYWKRPSRPIAVALVVAQLTVLLTNAIARQSVQVSELMKWYDPAKARVRGEWGSFALFVVMFLAAILIIFWIGLTALRRCRSRTA
jgi:hypothetical protein